MQYHRLVFAALLIPATFAGSLKSVREIPLSDYVRVPGPFSDRLRVSAMSFSPDEQWLAAIVEHGRAARLLVLSRERRPDSLRYAGTVPPVQARKGEFGAVAWSPDGNSVLVGSNPPVLIDLKKETSCQLEAGRPPEVVLAGFTSAKDIVIAEVGQSQSRLVIYDVNCKPVQYRDLESRVISAAASSASGSIAVLTADGRLSIYDAATGKVVKSWGRPIRAQVGLLASGELVCEAARPSRERVQPECWSVKEENTQETPPAAGGAPFSAAARGPLAAFTDGKYSYDAFFDTGKAGVRRAIVWNVARGAMVADWKPDQEGCGGIDDIWTDCRSPVVFALSPEGNYLADVKSGQLRIQRVMQ